MTLTNDRFIDQISNLAQSAGFSEWELYFEDSDSLKLQAFKGEIIDYSSSRTQGVNFRGIFQGQSGSAYTEVLDDESAETIVLRAKESARLTEVDDPVYIYSTSSTYPQIDLVHPALKQANIQRKIDLVLRNEQQAWDTGKLDKIYGTFYNDGYTRKRTVNSHGIDLSYDHNLAMMYMEVIASDSQSTYSATEYEINSDFDALEQSPLGLTVVEKVVARKGSRPVASGQYPIVLENTAAASLLAAHMSIFSAEAAQKGMSLLKGKEGQSVASSAVSVVDDPLLPGGMASAPFDGEAVPCRHKYMVHQGTLETLLHNLKTAHKDHRETTGNASRGGYKGNIGVSHFNAFIEKGTFTQSDLLAQMNRGLLITEFDGLHSGTNAITGDFSLGARGFWIENGSIAHPVNQIVLSGNIFTLLKEIDGIGNNLRFYFQPVGSPSLLIRSMSVAGA